ncbi:hypothetical protein BGX24_006315 [Mortierella sp. AD032]|nr:hypothetical protein BGX24_006315 [Mortierella sp. AD032]
MKLIASFAILATSVTAAVSAQTGGSVELANCAANPQLTTTSVSISPSPMCITKPYCLSTTGILSNDLIDSGEGFRNTTFAVSGRYLGRLIYTDRKDICQLLAESGTPCPIPAGPVTLKICNNLKINLPPNINYAFTFTATNGDGGQVFCRTGRRGEARRTSSSSYGANPFSQDSNQGPLNQGPLD